MSDSPNQNNISSSINSPRKSSQPDNSKAGSIIYPISSITTFTQRNWAFIGRCTSKSGVRTYKGRDGSDNRIASVDMIDSSGDIKLTFFNTSIEDRYDKMEIGKTYYVSHGSIRPANKRYSKSNYDITIQADSVIEESEDDKSLPDRSQTFIPLSALSHPRFLDTQNDVAGIVYKVDEVTSVISKKDNRSLAKRQVTIVDDSKSEIDATIWGNKADSFLGRKGDAIILQNARVTDFNGYRVLNIGDQSSVEVNPKGIKRAEELEDWWKKLGGEGREGGESSSIPEFHKIESSTSSRLRQGEQKQSLSLNSLQLAEADLGGDPKSPDYVDMIAHIAIVKHNGLWYLACPNTKCLKKVQPEDEVCQCGHNFTTQGPAVMRYTLNFQIVDAFSSFWASCFDEAGKVLMKMTAEQLSEYLQENPDNLDTVLNNFRMIPYQFHLRVRKVPNTGGVGSQNADQGDTRTSYTVVHVGNVDYGQASIKLLQEINRYEFDSNTL